MLNLITPEIEDQQLLENSYNSIRRKDLLEIVTDEKENQAVLMKAINALKKPGTASISFQNLFRLNYPNKQFYIAQLLVDYNYPTGDKGSQTYLHRYSYHTVGIAFSTINFGITNLRPETKIDKLVDLLFTTDIDFESAEHFSNSYYLASTEKAIVKQHFDNKFLNCLAKYEDILLTIDKNEVYVSFTSYLDPDQSRAIEDIFCNCKFIATHGGV